MRNNEKVFSMETNYITHTITITCLLKRGKNKLLIIFLYKALFCKLVTLVLTIDALNFSAKKLLFLYAIKT